MGLELQLRSTTGSQAMGVNFLVFFYFMFLVHFVVVFGGEIPPMPSVLTDKSDSVRGGDQIETHFKRWG